ncbi:MAG: hypothetical protein ACRD36_08180 [Candidatus Acidiferrum sp.]
MKLPLSTAIEIATRILQTNEEGTSPRHQTLTIMEAAAIRRLIEEADITLQQISQGVIRREGATR